MRVAKDRLHGGDAIDALRDNVVTVLSNLVRRRSHSSSVSKAGYFRRDGYSELRSPRVWGVQDVAASGAGVYPFESLFPSECAGIESLDQGRFSAREVPGSSIGRTFSAMPGTR